ncbi:MAG TPA: hypothetical protein VKY26_11080 [Actinomycetota bacterium]|nr:hypothetical protein [Actinomycetota bacterium]
MRRSLGLIAPALIAALSVAAAPAHAADFAEIGGGSVAAVAAAAPKPAGLPAATPTAPTAPRLVIISPEPAPYVARPAVVPPAVAAPTPPVAVQLAPSPAPAPAPTPAKAVAATPNPAQEASASLADHHGLANPAALVVYALVGLLGAAFALGFGYRILRLLPRR